MTPSRKVFRALFLLGVALALTLRLPGVATPFFADDLVQMGFLAGGDPGTYAFENELDLFRFYGGDEAAVERKLARGDLPWRFESTQRCAFFRPVASALMALDHALFGTSPWPAHVHSLFWFAVFLGVLHRLYRSLFPLAAARVATLAAAFSPASAIPIEWWSARNSLLAAVFGVGALLLYRRWSESRRAWDLGLALAVLSLGLLSAESGVQILGYLVAFALLGVRGTWSSRVARAAPAVGLFLVYMVVRAALGYGVRGNALYVDPLGEPAAYLAHLVRKIVPTVAAATTGPGSSPWILLGVAFVAVGIGWGAARREPGRRRTLAWCALGSALALLLCFGGRNSMRPWTLVIPQVGVHALLAWAITRPWAEGGRPGPARLLARVGACALFFLCVLAPARPLLSGLRSPGGGQPTAAELAAQFPPEVRGALTDEVRTIVFLRAPVTVMPIDRLERWHAVGGLRRDELATLVLSDRGALFPEAAGIVATRTGPSSLSIVSERPLVKGNDIFRFDDRVPLETGARIEVGEARVHVRGTARGRPSAIDVDLPHDFDGPETVFLSWTGGRYAVVPAPAVGGTFRLP